MAAIPLKVNLRSLMVRRTATLLTIGGIGLILMILVLVWSLDAGLRKVFTVSGDPTKLLVLRQGSTAETTSGFTREQFRIISSVEGIDRDAKGEPLASGDLVVLINQLRRGSATESANVVVRGVTAAGLAMRPEVRIVEGRTFEPGNQELIVSRAMASRFQDFGLGDTLVMRKAPYRVVGIFDAHGSPYDSELWTDAIDLGDTHLRPGYSAILLKVSDEAAQQRVKQIIEADPQVPATVKTQVAYFAAQTEAAAPIQVLATLMTFFLSIGACLSAANTMYASVLSRSREIGTLRSLGFSRMSILFSYVVEAIVVAGFAGAVGLALGALVLALQTGAAGTSNWNTFSEVAFHFAITPGVVALAAIVSAVIGVLGGFAPALRAARMPIVEALRAA